MSAVDATQVTIVSGLPRSGTSLMMQMIQAGGIPPLIDNQRTADEDNPRGYLEFEAVKKTKQDASWLADAPGKVVKMVHLLLYDLPPNQKYHVVLMRRHMKEVLASQRKMLERHGRSGAALAEEQLGAIFAGQMEKLTAWLAAQPNFAVTEVKYNELLESPQPVIDRLADFLGGGLDRTKMFAAIDPSLYRNRA